jgi:hypothetical protein
MKHVNVQFRPLSYIASLGVQIISPILSNLFCITLSVSYVLLLDCEAKLNTDLLLLLSLFIPQET